MEKPRVLSIFIAICVFFALCSPCLAADAPETGSKCVIIGDAVSGNILYSVNADERAEPASITKIMTLLLAVEAVERGDVSLDDMVTAPADCRFDLTPDSSTAQIYRDEVLSLRDIIHCAALISANEACNIIAEYTAGSIADFVVRMNERAAEIGCENTHFVNTHGLPDAEHYTTARDLFTIARECMSHEIFRTVVGTAEYDTAVSNATGPRHLKNSNALINENSVYTDKYFYEGATGIKTGHTEAAGFCLVGSAERDGISLISVVLGAGGDADMGEYFGSFEDTVKLFDWVFENYSRRLIVAKGAFVGTQNIVSGGIRGETDLCTGEELTALAPNELEYRDLVTELTLYDELASAPLSSERSLGELRISDSAGNFIGSVPVVPSGEPRYDEPLPAPEPEAEDAELMIHDKKSAIVTTAALIAALVTAAVCVSVPKRNKTKGRKK